MPNPFDAFDAPAQTPQSSNPFDQFDSGAASPQGGGVMDWLKNAFSGAHVANDDEYRQNLASDSDIEAAKQAANTPLIPKQYLPVEWYAKGVDQLGQYLPEGAARSTADAYAGYLHGLAGVTSGLSTPVNAGLMAAMPEGVLANRLVAGTFLGQAIYGTPSKWTQIQDAYARGDYKAVSELSTEMGASYLPALAILHAGGGEAPKPDEPEAATPPPAQPTASSIVPPPQEGSFKTQPALESQTARYAPPPEEAPEAVNAEAGLDKGPPAPVLEPGEQLSAEDGGIIDEAPNVREPLSLDELRLMRERSDLQLQQDLSQRATGSVHPAITERLNEIEAELDALANREAAPTAGVPQEALDATRTQPAAAEPEAAEPEAEPGAPPQAQPQPSAAAPKTAKPIGVAEEYAKADLGSDAVVPGEGKTWEEARDYGRKYINEGGDPRLPIRRAKATGTSGWKEVGIVSAEYERLARETQRAANDLAADPTNIARQKQYDAAEAEQAAWRKELQPVLTKASSALNAARGQRVVNPGSYADLQKLAIDNMGKNARALTPQERTALARGAKDYNKVSADSVDAMEKVRQEARKQAGGKTMSLDDLKKSAQDFTKEKLADCAI